MLPGAATFLGGLILLFARSRALTLLGAWLAILAGAWLIVGLPLQHELTLGSLGVPIGSSSGQRAGETLGLFVGVGALILFFGAVAFGRLSVVSARDLRHAERREAERAEAERAEADALTAREQAEPAPTTGRPVGTDVYDQHANHGATAATEGPDEYRSQGEYPSQTGYSSQTGYPSQRLPVAGRVPVADRVPVSGR